MSSKVSLEKVNLQKKRIVFITNYFLPHGGGVENHLWEVSKRLQEKYSVDIIAHKHDASLRSVDQIHGINVHRFSYPKVKFLGLIFIWIIYLRYVPLFLKSDIIHIHDVFIWFLPYRIVFPFKKVFVTFHGWEGKSPIPIISVLQKKLAARLSNGYLCVGRYLKKYFGLKNGVVIYGGISELSKTEQRKERDIKVLYLGRLSVDTDLPLLLEVLKEHKLKITFCGEGELSSICKKYGRVVGYKANSSKYLLRTQVCISVGFLSTMNSLSLGCSTIVLAKNKVRYDAFFMTPFHRWIYLVRTKEQLLKKLRYSLKWKKSRIPPNSLRKVLSSQSWDNVSDKYIRLWGI